MKKVVIFLIGILTILNLIMIKNLFKTQEEKLFISDFKEKNIESSISMLYETSAGSGEYIESSETSWPTNGYTFNSSLSKCENGGTLSWDDTTKKVLMSTNASDKCYVYFDVNLSFLLSSVSQRGDNHGKLYLNNTLIDVEKLLNTEIIYKVGDVLKYENLVAFRDGQGFYVYDENENLLYNMYGFYSTSTYILTGKEKKIVSYASGTPEPSLN